MIIREYYYNEYFKISLFAAFKIQYLLCGKGMQKYKLLYVKLKQECQKSRNPISLLLRCRHDISCEHHKPVHVYFGIKCGHLWK